MCHQLLRLILLAFIAILSACSGGGDPGTTPAAVPTIPAAPPVVPIGPNQILLTWAANREARVNQAGGGYLVYLSKNNGFNIGDGGVTILDVKFDPAKSSTPLYTLYDIVKGTTYYSKVRAYMTLSAGSTVVTSDPTAQITITP